jgi:hypothetical protein
MKRIWEFAALAIVLLPCWLAAGGAEVIVLREDTWDAVPQGKEVDAIYGDFVLRNEHLVAVIAQPLATRNANMTVRGVGGCLIDLTQRRAQNDQLSCYYPGAGRYQFTAADKTRLVVDGQPVDAGGADFRGATGRSVVLEFDAQPQDGKPNMTVRYTLDDKSAFVLVETVYTNPSNEPLVDDLSDAIRADRTFKFGTDPATGLFWADDEWFRQCYGVVVPGYDVKSSGQRGLVLALHKDGTDRLALAVEKSQLVARRIFPAASLLAARGMANQQAAVPTRRIRLQVYDGDFVPAARIALTKDGQPYGGARTDELGQAVFELPAGQATAEVTTLDGRKASVEIPAEGLPANSVVKLPPASYVVARIVNAAGKPTPAKVSFAGKEGAANPDWGPDSGHTAIKNVYYTHTGSFRQAIAPGKYDVIVSYGPEHDAVFTSLDVPPGGQAELSAVLKRTVDTTGWISSDFHSHSSPSGDNTSSQLGRVQNLLCEHIEFAPCTEHNRIDTYVPHLRRLAIEHLLATCTGMELTGGPLPVNHQNAFPLVYRPRTQDGGAPTTDVDPVIQVERLALWDNKSEKLVQMNHPNLPQILGDRNEDGQPDAGFERMFGFVDVIEVHPPQGILKPPAKMENGKLERNPIFHWMQMLNLGYRRTGVINTDSHYNYHESGYFRNFIRCSTDDPAKIDTMEIVRMAEQGRLVVSTGPFLTVQATATTADGRVVTVGPGESVAAEDCQLAIRVQCPNWHDINRVQVFLNGRPAKELNFTRRTTPDRFSDQTVRFEAQVPLKLATDTHVIVAAIGEEQTLGPVMGPNYGGNLPPVAVSNPIFLDADGGGFKPNGDLLDVPIAIAPR